MMYVNNTTMHNTMQVCDQCGYQTGGICDMCGNVTPQYENIGSMALHLHTGIDLQQNTHCGDNDGEIKIQMEETNFESEESNSAVDLSAYDSLGVLTTYETSMSNSIKTNTQDKACISSPEYHNTLYENKVILTTSTKCDSSAISKGCDSAASLQCNNITQPSIASKQSQSVENLNTFPETPVAPKSLGLMINKMAYHCTKCAAKFLELGQCLDHLIKTHNIKVNVDKYSELKSCAMYQCSLCSQSDNVFFSLDVLANHMQLHGIKVDKQQAQGEAANLECQVCQAKFSSNTSLSEHTQKISYYVFSMASRSIFYCKLCNKYFFIFKLYQNHYHRRHKSKNPGSKLQFKEKIKKIFECSACKSTGPKYHLNRDKFALHLKTAHGLVLGTTGKSACMATDPVDIKPVKISVIQPVNSRNKIMQRQTFKCGVCEAAFIMKASCLEHLEQEHELIGSEGESNVVTKLSQLVRCDVCSTSSEKFWYDAASADKHVCG